MSHILTLTQHLLRKNIIEVEIIGGFNFLDYSLTYSADLVQPFYEPLTYRVTSCALITKLHPDVLHVKYFIAHIIKIHICATCNLSMLVLFFIHL